MGEASAAYSHERAQLPTSRYSDIESIARAHLEKRPEAMAAALDLIKVHMERAEYTQAIETCDYVLHLFPHAAIAQSLKAMCLEQVGRFLDARECLEEGLRNLDVIESLASVPPDLTALVSGAQERLASQLYYDLGRLQFQQREYAQAANSFHQAAELSHGHWQAEYGAGTCWSALGDEQRASDHFKRALTLNGDPAYLLPELALRKYRATGELPAELIEQMTRDLGLQEWRYFGESLFVWAGRHGKTNDVDGLVALLVDQGGDRREELIESVLGVYFHVGGRCLSDVALQWLLKRRLSSRSLSILCLTALRWNGEVVDAKRAVSEIDKRYPQDVEVAKLIGLLFYSREQYCDSLLYFERASVRPFSVQEKCYWAIAEAQCGHFDRAEEIVTFEDDGEGLRAVARGMIAYMRGDLQRAAEFYERRLEVARDPVIAEELAELYVFFGRLEDAERIQRNLAS